MLDDESGGARFAARRVAATGLAGGSGEVGEGAGAGSASAACTDAGTVVASVAGASLGALADMATAGLLGAVSNDRGLAGDSTTASSAGPPGVAGVAAASTPAALDGFEVEEGDTTASVVCTTPWTTTSVPGGENGRPTAGTGPGAGEGAVAEAASGGGAGTGAGASTIGSRAGMGVCGVFAACGASASSA
jgi:hypothetical protein